MECRENAVELLQRFRRDRRILLDFILAGSLIKKVIMPPGAVTLDDVDLDQVSVDYVLNCAKKGGQIVFHYHRLRVAVYVKTFLLYIESVFDNVGGMLELSEAIRDYHDHTGLPPMVCAIYGTSFF